MMGASLNMMDAVRSARKNLVGSAIIFRRHSANKSGQISTAETEKRTLMKNVMMETDIMMTDVHKIASYKMGMSVVLCLGRLLFV